MQQLNGGEGEAAGCSILPFVNTALASQGPRSAPPKKAIGSEGDRKKYKEAKGAYHAVVNADVASKKRGVKHGRLCTYNFRVRD